MKIIVTIEEDDAKRSTMTYYDVISFDIKINKNRLSKSENKEIKNETKEQFNSIVKDFDNLLDDFIINKISKK